MFKVGDKVEYIGEEVVYTKRDIIYTITKLITTSTFGDLAQLDDSATNIVRIEDLKRIYNCIKPNRGKFKDSIV